MEIKTCEEYVLNELYKAQDKNISLKDELNCAIYNWKADSEKLDIANKKLALIKDLFCHKVRLMHSAYSRGIALDCVLWNDERPDEFNTLVELLEIDFTETQPEEDDE